MNSQLIETLKERLPDFHDLKKLSNLEARVTKLHQINGKYEKQVFNNFSQALTVMETKLKAKQKLAKELCKTTAGTFIIVFELSAAESKKKLDKALEAARNEYENWITQQQEEWLSEQLEETLQEQAEIATKNQEELNAKLKAQLLLALQTN